MDDINQSKGRYISSIAGREFRVGMPSENLDAIQAGTLKLTYRGLRFPKNPFDIVLYMRLLERLRPKAIIEIGTSEGGGALWFADVCSNLGIGARIITIDICPPKEQYAGVDYLAGDAYDPYGTFPSELLKSLPHPWLISEDSAHTYDACTAVLNYLVPQMRRGDYFVMEDGVVADLTSEAYLKFEDGPNRAIANFLECNSGMLEIDTDLCDLFGHNVTYAPNAWLRRL